MAKGNVVINRKSSLKISEIVTSPVFLHDARYSNHQATVVIAHPPMMGPSSLLYRDTEIAGDEGSQHQLDGNYVSLLGDIPHAPRPPMKQDYYTDLGVSKSATEAEIKSAYRQLVREHHPDRQGDPVKFRAVAEAYEVLGDPVKRQAYESAQNNARIVDLKTESSALVEEYFRQFTS